MILGMSTAAFTEFHVLLSLIGIVSGIIVVFGMLKSNLMPAMTSIFLVTTVATSVTGFMFDSPFGPARVVGIISLGVLVAAIAALYGFKLAGRWRVAYVASAVVALYLNCFVGVVQTFLKIPFFHALAPTQKEPPFGIAQALVFIVLLALGIAAARKFHPVRS
jgi:hypothetical protein